MADRPARQTKAQIERAVTAALAGAKSAGIDIGAVEVLPDGTVRIERASESVAPRKNQPQDRRTPIQWT